jgi:hypothetical protein
MEAESLLPAELPATATDAAAAEAEAAEGGSDGAHAAKSVQELSTCATLMAGGRVVPVQMWQGWAQSRCRCGRGVERTHFRCRSLDDAERRLREERRQKAALTEEVQKLTAQMAELGENKEKLQQALDACQKAIQMALLRP